MLVNTQTIKWVCDICGREHTIADRIAVNPFSDKHIAPTPEPPTGWLKLTPATEMMIDGKWVKCEVVCCQHNIQITGTNKS